MTLVFITVAICALLVIADRAWLWIDQDQKDGIYHD
jgi:hypothetical protein